MPNIEQGESREGLKEVVVRIGDEMHTLHYADGQDLVKQLEELRSQQP